MLLRRLRPAGPDPSTCVSTGAVIATLRPCAFRGAPLTPMYPASIENSALSLESRASGLTSACATAMIIGG